jgi:hypothetical protein
MVAESLLADSVSLPKEVVEFHLHGRSPATGSSYGEWQIGIRPIAELAIEPIEIEPCVADFFLPRPDNLIVSEVPKLAVNLATISAGEYDTYRLLLWLPEVGRYAIWNALDHSVRLFGPHVCWQEIVAVPEQFPFGRATGELHIAPDYQATGQFAEAKQRQLTVAALLRIRRPRFRDFAYYSLALVTLLVFGFMMLTSELPAISPETFDQIEIGMKEHEVMRIVRGSPGWYRGDESEPAYIKGGYDYPTRYGWNDWIPISLEKGNIIGRKKQYVWASNDGELTVEFDDNGSVSYATVKYPPGRRLSHPERWPWWKRLLNRETPGREPPRIYSPF